MIIRERHDFDKHCLSLLIFAIMLLAFIFPSSMLANLPPSIDAGFDQTITIFDSTFLNGASPDDGLPSLPGAASVSWNQMSGPGTISFDKKDKALTTATFPLTGTHVLRLAVSDRDPTGSDDASITVTPTSPHTIRIPQDYPSIQAGIDAAKNDDIVMVSPGTYSGSLTLRKAVTLTSMYLTSGDKADIAGTILDGAGGSYVLNIPVGTKDRPTIMGFTIQNASDGVSPKAKVNFLNNIVRNTSDGIDYESGSGGLCRFNIFEKNSDDGIDLDYSVDIKITDNIIRNNGDDGIEIRLHEYSGPILNIIICNNIITGNDEDGIQIIDYSDLSSRFILIERNLIKNNAMAGLGLMDNGETIEDYRAASIPERIHVFNNTFSGNDHGLTGGDNLIALNNLFVNSTTLGIKHVDGSSIAAYNLFWNNGVSRNEHDQGSNLDYRNTRYADPLLDRASHLQTGSPAIDAGTFFFKWQKEIVLNIPSTEFHGAAPDLGLYEKNFAPPVQRCSDGR